MFPFLFTILFIGKKRIKMETTKNYIVYSHISPNGKYYIGITCQNVEERWGCNGYKYITVLKNGKLKHPHFGNAILKYGWNNFKHKILFSNLTEKEAKEKEKELIKEAKEKGLSYNLTDGGDGINGYKFSEEHRKKMSMAKIGVKQTPETIAKRVTKNTGKKRTDEQKSKRSKAVEQYSLDGKLIATFFGLREAGRKTDINYSHIGDCCNNKPNRLTAGGYVWKWKI